MRSFIFLLVLLPLINGLRIMRYKSFVCNSEELNQTETYLPMLIQKSFINCENITSLSFPRNNINVINNDAFKYLKKIKTINLSFNNISTLPTEIFSDTPQIEDINFSYNNFTFLQKNLFANLSKLRSVNFQFNKITNVNENCFVNVPALTVINLANNNLKTLQLNLTDDIEKLKEFDLSGNPWHCDSNLCETMYAVVTQFWWQIEDLPVCSSPNHVTNITWQQIVRQSTPIIITDLNNDEATDRNRITMQCHSCSKTTLSWLFGNKTLTYETKETSGDHFSLSTFSIDSVTSSDLGYYTCYADQYTSKTKSDTVHLYIDYLTATEEITTSSHGRIIAITLPIGAILSILTRIFYKCVRKRKDQSLFNFVPLDK